MKLLMAVSADGFVAKGPVDDMSWTGAVDKAIFKLLTLTGDKNIYAGSNTYNQMPALKNRELRCLSSNYMKGYTLGNVFCSDSWLIGGQTVALEAIARNCITEVYLCHTNIELKDGIKITDEIKNFGKKLDIIKFPNVLVEIREK